MVSTTFFDDVAEKFRETLEAQRDSCYPKSNLTLGGSFSSETQINDVRSSNKIVIRSRVYRNMNGEEVQAKLDLQLLRYPSSREDADLLANYSFVATNLDSNESSAVVLETVRAEAMDMEPYHVLLQHASKLICLNVSCLVEAVCGTAPLIDIHFDV